MFLKFLCFAECLFFLGALHRLPLCVLVSASPGSSWNALGRGVQQTSALTHIAIEHAFAEV